LGWIWNISMEMEINSVLLQKKKKKKNLPNKVKKINFQETEMEICI